MTEAEMADLKGKIKKVMVDHLTTIGYPNIPNEQIMGELKAMWIKIEEAGLVTDGMNFQAFAEHAESQFMIAQVKDLLGI